MDFGNGRNLGVRAAAMAAVFHGAPQWRRREAEGGLDLRFGI
jgi:hypothetical protein